MAVRPTPPGGDGLPPAMRRALQRVKGDAPSRPKPNARAVSAADDEPLQPDGVSRRFARLKAAVTDLEIEQQIARLMRLISRGEIDGDAPRGTYLNLLV